MVRDVSLIYSGKCFDLLIGACKKGHLSKHQDLIVISRPWKMYPLGFLFGLGFDTSSEVAVLGIASIQGAKGTSIWLILIFPLLFTGM